MKPEEKRTEYVVYFNGNTDISVAKYFDKLIGCVVSCEYIGKYTKENKHRHPTEKIKNAFIYSVIKGDEKKFLDAFIGYKNVVLSITKHDIDNTKITDTLEDILERLTDLNNRIKEDHINTETYTSTIGSIIRELTQTKNQYIGRDKDLVYDSEIKKKYDLDTQPKRRIKRFAKKKK